MKDYIVKTNFGRTYKYTAEQVAKDYADTAVQFDDNELSWEENYNLIIKDQDWLDQWFGDYIGGYISIIVNEGELIDEDKSKLNQFLGDLIGQYGRTSWK